LLPVLNALTTDKHLLATIAHEDWALAAVDLTFFAFGAVFGVIAWRLRRRWAQDSVAVSSDTSWQGV
jgi:hypothetical protein